MVAGLLAVLVVLSACGDDAPVPAGGGSVAGGAAEAAPDWRLQITGVGASLAYVAGGEERVPFRLACVRDPAAMTMESETTAPIGSEERFSLGIDGEVWVFVADVAGAAAEPLGGVRAERPIDGEVLAALEDASEIGASYGATNLGPYPAPAREDRANFIAACRQILRG